MRIIRANLALEMLYIRYAGKDDGVKSNGTFFFAIQII